MRVAFIVGLVGLALLIPVLQVIVRSRPPV